MAFEGKFLIDHNLPISLYEELKQKNNIRTALSRDLLPDSERAEDIDILLYAGQHNYHVVTGDQGFLRANTHPCGVKYARRTVLTLPAYHLNNAARYLLAAWKEVTWNGLKQYDAFEVQEQHVIAYRCDGKQYVEEKRWAYKIEH